MTCLVGRTFGKLSVLSLARSDARHRKYYLCKCTCGNDKVVNGASLVSGNTKSCGCLSREARAATRLPGNASEITAVILGYKRHAKARGYVWGLSREQVEDLIKRSCVYCGTEPSNIKSTKNTIAPLLYNGIDRVDNRIGYVPDNVAPCCAQCNRAKGTLSAAEFVGWANRIAEQWG